MKIKYILILGVMIVWGVIILNAVYNATGFHVVSSNPHNGGKINYTDAVVVGFNKSLAPIEKQSVSLSPSVQGIFAVTDKSIRFAPASGFSVGTNYTLTIKSPASKAGDIGSDITIHFSVNYVDFSNLPTAQKQAAVQNTDGINKKYPLLQYVPYSSDHFAIAVDLGTGAPIYTITLYATLDASNQFVLYKSQIRQYRQEALDFIRAKGTDPSTIPINWNPSNALDI